MDRDFLDDIGQDGDLWSNSSSSDQNLTDMSIDAVPEALKVPDCEEQVAEVAASRTISLPSSVPYIESSVPTKIFSLQRHTTQFPLT